jgi:hypothetical protein
MEAFNEVQCNAPSRRILIKQREFIQILDHMHLKLKILTTKGKNNCHGTQKRIPKLNDA